MTIKWGSYYKCVEIRLFVTPKYIYWFSNSRCHASSEVFTAGPIYPFIPEIYVHSQPWGFSTPCILGSPLLISTHQSILVSDLLYNAPLSTPLPVLVVAVTLSLSQATMLHSAWRHTGKSSWTGELLWGRSTRLLRYGTHRGPFCRTAQQYDNFIIGVLTSTRRVWMGLTHNIYLMKSYSSCQWAYAFGATTLFDGVTNNGLCCLSLVVLGRFIHIRRRILSFQVHRIARYKFWGFLHSFQHSNHRERAFTLHIGI